MSLLNKTAARLLVKAIWAEWAGDRQRMPRHFLRDLELKTKDLITLHAINEAKKGKHA